MAEIRALLCTSQTCKTSPALQSSQHWLCVAAQSAQVRAEHCRQLIAHSHLRMLTLKRTDGKQQVIIAFCYLALGYGQLPLQ